MDDETAVRLRTALLRVVRQLNATSTGEGLTPSQASALGLIAGRGPLRLADLSELERLNPTMVSRMVQKLTALGLIERQPHPEDLRAAQVSITSQGLQVHQRIKTKRTAILLNCLADMPTDAVEDLRDAVPALELLAERLAEGGAD